MFCDIKKFMSVSIASIVSLFLGACASSNECEIKTARNVDLERYMGKWYEIARYENSFEKGVIRAYAIYTLTPNSDVRVQNFGERANQKKSSAEGIAYSANNDNSKLRVSFFWPFYGDYYILELDENYQWALVGGRDKSYLWILARSPQMDNATLQKVLELAQMRGYDTKKLIWNNYLDDLKSAGSPNN